jgi:uncharacterized membrane protein YhaH (DUF805 family)
MEWMLMPYRKLYALIAGRSSRKEFWMFFLLNVIVYFVFIAIILSLAGGAASMMNVNSMQTAMLGAGFGLAAILIIPLYIWALLTSVAAIAVVIRRFHDLNLSGWLYLAYIVAMFLVAAVTQSLGLYAVLSLALLGLMAVPGTKGPNKYGDDPTNPTSAAVFA